MKEEEKFDLLAKSITFVLAGCFMTVILFVYANILQFDFGISALHDPVVCGECGFLYACFLLYRECEKDQKASVDV